MPLSTLSCLPPEVLFGLAALLGLVVGSFLNVVIHRLPVMLERDWQAQCAALQGKEVAADSPSYNLLTPASTCPFCGHRIRAWENIPVLSYLFLRGRCSACKAPISLRYPLVEILSAVLSGFVMLHFGPTLQMLAALIFVWALLALTYIDYDTQLLPDDITLPLLWLGLLLNWQGVFTSLPDALLGAVFGYLSLWSVYWGFKLLTGKEGMGYGDFKLLAALGAWMGWQMLPGIILLSSIVGAIVGVTLIILRRQDSQKPIPFGPYLAGGGLVSLFYGQQLIAWYLAR